MPKASRPQIAPVRRIAVRRGAFSLPTSGALGFAIKYILYLLRWQLSTPILAVIIMWLGAGVWQTIVANLVGGLIFFWVDRWIFRARAVERWIVEEWEYKDNVACADCGKICRGRRLVFTPGYDRRDDGSPQYRCPECSQRKLEAIRRALAEKGYPVPHGTSQ